jgi:hypothetical protein
MSVKNAPTHHNDGGFEKKTAVPAHAPADATAGANSGSAAYLYEQRCVQENGTH